MNTNTITKLLEECDATRQNFIGCFPIDHIPAIHPLPASMVINLDPSTQRGSHWVACYACSPFVVYYFDSLAMEPPVEIAQYLNRFTHSHRNKHMIQSMSTNVCGEYCIYWIYWMSIGIPNQKILKSLENSRPDSDHLVKNFVKLFL